MVQRKAKAEDTADLPRPDVVEGAPHPAAAPRLFGQEAAERTFREARAGGRLPHGWLLSGPEGVGKATLAYRLARAMIAGEDELDAPEHCPVAARIRAGSEPRLQVLRRGVNPRTGKLRTEIVVEDVRAVREFLHYTMPDGGWRVVIVDPADEMNRSSANALLKFLEEPPERTLLLLIAHGPGGLLPTIRSRCRRLDLRPLGPEALAAALEQAGAPVARDRAEALSALAGGSAGRAVRLLAADGLAIYADLVAAFRDGQLDRSVALELSGLGPTQRERARLTADLALVLVARLARAAVAGAPGPEAAAGEHALMARVAGQGALWAETAARLTGRTDHAFSVNLDPGQVILDMILDIDAAFAAPRAP